MVEGWQFGDVVDVSKTDGLYGLEFVHEFFDALFAKAWDVVKLRGYDAFVSELSVISDGKAVSFVSKLSEYFKSLRVGSKSDWVLAARNKKSLLGG